MQNEMTLHITYVYNEANLCPVCEKSYALFTLMNRGSIKMNELFLVKKLGFTIKLTGGETKRFTREMKKSEEQEV